MSLAICLLGFGEVGQTLAADLQKRGGIELAAWDIQFATQDSQPSRAIAALPIRRAELPQDAARDADIVISAVTASQDYAAAAALVEYLKARAYFVDLNSVAPHTRQRVSELVERHDARYVEVAVMSPIAPRRIATPMLLGGPHAESFLPIARSLGFGGATVYASTIGKASAAKLCRSIVVKGLEALLTEALVSARHYGVQATVLESLSDLLPGHDWPRLACYMMGRSMRHGERRAEEMREAAHTVRDSGLTPWMSEACVERQRWAACGNERMDDSSLERVLECLAEKRSC